MPLHHFRQTALGLALAAAGGFALAQGTGLSTTSPGSMAPGTVGSGMATPGASPNLGNTTPGLGSVTPSLGNTTPGVTPSLGTSNTATGVATSPCLNAGRNSASSTGAMGASGSSSTSAAASAGGLGPTTGVPQTGAPSTSGAGTGAAVGSSTTIGTGPMASAATGC